MANTRKGAPARRPVKAKGTLPAPRVAPARAYRPIHRRPGVLIAAGIVLAALVGVAIWQTVAWRQRARGREELAAAIRRFDRAVALLQAPVRDVLVQMTSSPDGLASGQVSADDFRAQTEKWTTELRRLADELRTRSVPTELDEARSMMIQGAALYLDAAKVLALAASAEDAALRDQVLAEGRNVLYHADFVWGNGQRTLQQIKRDLGLAREGETPLLDTPRQEPQEEAPPASGQAPVPVPTPS